MHRGTGIFAMVFCVLGSSSVQRSYLTPQHGFFAATSTLLTNILSAGLIQEGCLLFSAKNI